MKVEVEVISKEMVKPSSPTPHHLRHYSLSFLDQLNPHLNISMVYFFLSDASNSHQLVNASDRLKTSLSYLLTHYYPLAGRLVKHQNLVLCNDEGVPFVEARVRCHVSDVIENPLPAEISKLLPFQVDDAVETVFGVQVNVFDCGGIAVGACVSHKVADAMSYFQVIKSWAAVTRGERERIRTHFQSSTLFPPKNMTMIHDPDSRITKEMIVSKIFVFDSLVIESLRSKYAKRMQVLNESQKPLSRVEVLSHFIWTRFMVATKEESTSNGQKIHLVGCTANIRRRMEPPLPEYAFGNYYWASVAFPTLDEEGECYDLVGQLREGLNKIEKDCVAKIRESGKQIGVALGGGLKKTVVFGFSSLCRFPVYDVDFGWGNPTWVGQPTWKIKNVVYFMDTKSGGGIEAYVGLAEEDMAKFERDEEFLAHVSATGLNRSRDVF